MLLADALDLQPGDVVALTGGGGKTSALYLLGRELAARHLPVVLTGTTRFTPPRRGPAPNLLFFTPDPAHPALPLAPGWPVTLATGIGGKGRLQPLPVDAICAVAARIPDGIVVIEADGSAMRPFKAPAAHEPAVPRCATVVVSVCGLDVLGRPLDERAVHRPERVAALAGVPAGTTIDEALVAAVLAHPDGGRKGVPLGARWVVLLNKADSAERRQRADRIGALLARVTDRVVIARLGAAPPVAELYQFHAR